jgi:hypothetical protein
MNIEDRIKRLEDHLGIEPKESEFKEGDWVYCFYDLHHQLRVFGKSYGFDGGGNWDCEMITSYNYYDKIRKATENEIKEALVREADRKFDGVKRVKRPSGFAYFVTNLEGEFNNSTYLRYCPHSDWLYYKGIIVYCKGEWATPLEEEKPKEDNSVEKIKKLEAENERLNKFVDHVEAVIAMGRLDSIGMIQVGLRKLKEQSDETI